MATILLIERWEQQLRNLMINKGPKTGPVSAASLIKGSTGDSVNWQRSEPVFTKALNSIYLKSDTKTIIFWLLFSKQRKPCFGMWILIGGITVNHLTCLLKSLWLQWWHYATTNKLVMLQKETEELSYLTVLKGPGLMGNSPPVKNLHRCHVSWLVKVNKGKK